MLWHSYELYEPGSLFENENQRQHRMNGRNDNTRDILDTVNGTLDCLHLRMNRSTSESTRYRRAEEEKRSQTGICPHCA